MEICKCSACVQKRKPPNYNELQTYLSFVVTFRKNKFLNSIGLTSKKQSGFIPGDNISDFHNMEYF